MYFSLSGFVVLLKILRKDREGGKQSGTERRTNIRISGNRRVKQRRATKMQRFLFRSMTPKVVRRFASVKENTIQITFVDREVIITLPPTTVYTTPVDAVSRPELGGAGPSTLSLFLFLSLSLSLSIFLSFYLSPTYHSIPTSPPSTDIKQMK